MTENTALTLPDEQTFRADLQAISKFQEVVRRTLIKDHDYGVIPGTGTKPTLLKPGAEKIAKLLGLADEYETTDKVLDWEKGFFHFEVKCKLIHIGTGTLISSGLGECNSMESKYRWRWVFQPQLPPELQGDEGAIARSKLVSRMITTSKGKGKQYRLENEDIYSQVNTLLKMAKKRALVDASLSAGRLSDLFTQDIEELKDTANFIDAEYSVIEDEPTDTQEHWCTIHNTAFFKKGKMKGYAHPIEGTDEWCNEPMVETPENNPPSNAPESKSSEPEPEKQGNDKASRDPESIKSITDLQKACEQDFGMKRADCLKELNITSWNELAITPREAYQEIAAVRK